ncbi:hypothetical protein [Desulfopila sp. IMCC35008]|uniref:hypothetical protein n=1 Tax=Desulfopila sp. IMCC35008 TaxID=2653858 RepID=UPI001F0F31A5|nr:hypothetical protein [Desulfopila sp. IMCC35008]
MGSGKAFNVVYLIKDAQRQELSDTRNRPQEIEGMAVMLACGLFQMPLKFTHDLVEGLNHLEVHLNAFSYHRV